MRAPESVGTWLARRCGFGSGGLEQDGAKRSLRDSGDLNVFRVFDRKAASHLGFRSMPMPGFKSRHRLHSCAELLGDVGCVVSPLPQRCHGGQLRRFATLIAPAQGGNDLGHDDSERRDSARGSCWPCRLWRRRWEDRRPRLARGTAWVPVAHEEANTRGSRTARLVR